MRILIILLLAYLIQCIMIGVFVLGGDVYRLKRHVIRDLIPFYWIVFTFQKLGKLMVEEWKELK